MLVNSIWVCKGHGEPGEHTRKAQVGHSGRSIESVSGIVLACLLLSREPSAQKLSLHVPSLSALTDTAYGNAPIVKLGLLVLLIAVGAVNLISRGRGPFGCVVRFELALAICVFVATGFLTTLPPADAEQQTVEDSGGLAASTPRSP